MTTDRWHFRLGGSARFRGLDPDRNLERNQLEPKYRTETERYINMERNLKGINFGFSELTWNSLKK